MSVLCPQAEMANLFISTSTAGMFSRHVRRTMIGGAQSSVLCSTSAFSVRPQGEDAPHPRQEVLTRSRLGGGHFLRFSDHCDIASRGSCDTLLPIVFRFGQLPPPWRRSGPMVAPELFRGKADRKSAGRPDTLSSERNSLEAKYSCRQPFPSWAVWAYFCLA